MRQRKPSKMDGPIGTTAGISTDCNLPSSYMVGQEAGPHFHRKKQKSTCTVLELSVQLRACPAEEASPPESASLPRLLSSTEAHTLLRT